MADVFNLFDSVKVPDYGESQFNGNHSVTTSARFGTIEPLECLNYYPGDKFRFKYLTEINFPPLLSPSYQRFKLNQYTFKVRKGLLFQNDDYQKFLLSAGGNDLNSVPLHPSIPYSPQNLYGEGHFCLRFDSTLPVYTLQGTDGLPYLQMNELPDTPSWNLFFRKLYLNGQSGNLHVDFPQDEQEYYWKQLFESIKVVVIDGSDSFTKGEVAFVNNLFTSFLNNLPNNGVDLRTPSNWSLVFHSAVVGGNNNHTSYLKLDTRLSVNPTYVIPPILKPLGLMEKLGYPCSNLYIDDLVMKGLRQYIFSLSNDDVDQGMPTYHSLSDWTSRSIVVCQAGYMSEAAFGFGSSNVNTHIISGRPGSAMSGLIDPLSLLQRFLEYSVLNGSAGGALVDEKAQAVITSIPIQNVFDMASVSDVVERVDHSLTYEDKNMDSCRLVGYHLIWNEYFRDANLTDPIPLYKTQYSPGTERHGAYDNTIYDPQLHLTQSSYESFKDWHMQRIVDFNRADASRMNFYDGTSLEVTDIRSWIECCVMLMYRIFEIPKKCIDRNYFTSALPSVAKVQVFAPVIPTMPENGATVDKSLIPDYTPVFASMAPDNTTFMSIDAFRTANIMESFYVNANLAGPRPVSFVLMMFGEHSQDFRMEIPVLVDASSSPLQIQELTQQSEEEKKKHQQERESPYENPENVHQTS